MRHQSQGQGEEAKAETGEGRGGRAVNNDPVELLRGIKELAARAGDIRHLKEFVDLLAD